MSSNINPNNIDGAYPVAGQDNNSQGFRDNFTNTKTNFEYAKSEITDLQTNVILKSPLSGTTLDNDMNGSLLYNAQLKQMSQTAVSLGSQSGSVAIDYTAGSYQTVTTGGSINLSFTNWPTAGVLGTMVVQVTVGTTAHTLTLTAAAGWLNAQGITGCNYTTGTTAVVTFAATGTYTFQITASDGGSTFTVTEVNKRLQPFNNSSEDLASTAAANLALTTSYFSTAVAETATLAAGVNGQIKTFCLSAPPLALSSVAITGTGGQFSCSATTLEVGQRVTIAGTLGGTGSITGYSDPTTYYIITTNGSTTFTLSASLGGGAITTTAGTPTGLTYSVVGPMVITVTNAGWKTSGTGTITVDTIGDACTLQYINSKWFCIGNNGAAFA